MPNPIKQKLLPCPWCNKAPEQSQDVDEAYCFNPNCQLYRFTMTAEDWNTRSNSSPTSLSWHKECAEEINQLSRSNSMIKFKDAVEQILRKHSTSPSIGPVMAQICNAALLPLHLKNVRCPLGDTGEYDDRTDIGSVGRKPILSDWNCDDDAVEKLIYIVHAANVLPALVEALEEFQNARSELAWNCPAMLDAADKLKKALTLAREVKIED